MNTRTLLKSTSLILPLLLSAGVQGALTQLANSPISGASSVEISPNVMFVLDDSGSMDWDYLPDWANEDPNGNAYPVFRTRNPGFNGLAYNRAITYSPPSYFDTNGNSDTTTYPSRTSARTSAWTSVPDDGYGVQSSGTSSLVASAYYFTVVPGEYCTDDRLRVCNAQSAATAQYPVPARLRWCTSSAEALAATPTAGACQATEIDPDPPSAPTNIPFNWPRMPAPISSTLTVSSVSSSSVTSITVNNQNILSAATTASSTRSTVATRIADSINACSSASAAGATWCQVIGYRAEVSGSTVTIYSPPGINNATPVVTATPSGSTTITATAFARSTTNLAPGDNLLTVISPALAQGSRAITRTDCAADPCTYAEEMTNYANWWAYYHTRMQSMKTAGSVSFQPITSSFRVGYMSINNNTGTDFQNIAAFTAANKKAWYDKLFAAEPNNATPLRTALANAGRLYAGRLNSTTFNGVTVTDPVQFYCQPNVTILSTDGYWNRGEGFRWDGATAVGDQDGPGLEVRPQLDGGPYRMEQSTRQIFETLTPTQATQAQYQTAQLQSKTSPLQASDFVWYQQTSTLQVSTTPQVEYKDAPLQARITQILQTAAMEESTSQLQRRVVPVERRTSSNFGSSWSAWSSASSCILDSSGRNQTQCQDGTPGAWQSVSSCSPAGGCSGTGDGSTCTPRTECQYAAWTAFSSPPSSGSTCPTGVAQSSGPNYTVGVARQCRIAASGWTNATSSCDPTRAYCQYIANPNASTSNWYNTASCTATGSIPSGTYPVTQVTECQVPWPANWSLLPAGQSCTPVTTGATRRQCGSTVWTNWNNATGPCTPSGTRSCQYTAWGPLTQVSSCTAAAQNNTNLTAIQCSAQQVTGFHDVNTCTQSSNQSCRYLDFSYYSWQNASSCTTVPIPTITAGTTYTAWAQQCQQVPVVGSWTNAASCTAGTGPTGLVTSCRSVVPPPTTQAVASCTPEAASASNGYVERTCNTVTTGPTVVYQCTPVAASAANNYVETLCNAVNLGPTSNTLADIAEYYWKTDLRDPSLLPDRCTGGPVVTGNITSYNNVCTNDQRQPRQYMSTYTLGLGASGLMRYQKDYETATSGDFYSVKMGQIANPTTGLCPWQSGGECNWPKPQCYADAWGNQCTTGSQANIDDLWHAAVNGRGTYYSATDPASLASGISGALTQITIRDGALAAVTVSSPNLTTGTNEIFEISFRIGEWSGDVVQRTIDGTTGAISATTAWSARTQLDSLVASGGHTARTIYTYNPSSGACSPATSNNLKPFLWANLCAAEQAYFNWSAISSLTQFCAVGTTCLPTSTSATLRNLVSGENLVNFIRGDRTNEGSLTNLAAYYRERVHMLGDIVGSEAVYVKGSPWNYADYNYNTFKTANQSRTPMVYVAANDGMLHALSAATGDEVWAYVPSIVLSRLYKLADKNYGAQGMHQFTVDGTPVYGDICASDCATPTSGSLPTVWKSILVGGLNNGGRGYYALDITDPASPKALWEFTHNNLGYTYGNPVITKLKDGTWVVMIASGYNNTGPGDGGGHLFILNANTGALIRTISTGVGDTTTPSGLARIAAWANFPDSNNTAQRAYGGDQFGNVWRFDVNGDIPVPATPPASPVYDAQRLATLLDSSNAAQPITTRPELGKVDGYPVVFIATGQMLGTNDLSSTQRQSVYAIKDRLIDADYGNPRTATGNNDFVEQTFSANTCTTQLETAGYCCTTASITAGTCTSRSSEIVTATSNAVDWDVKGGWYADLPVAGERVNTDLRLQLRTLAFSTNEPSVNNVCVPGGRSKAYFLDYQTGSYVQGTNGLVAVRLASSLSSSPTAVRLVDGTIRGLIRTDTPSTLTTPVPTAPTPLDTRRISWRELVTE